MRLGESRFKNFVARPGRDPYGPECLSTNSLRPTRLAHQGLNELRCQHRLHGDRHPTSVPDRRVFAAKPFAPAERFRNEIDAALARQNEEKRVGLHRTSQAVWILIIRIKL